MFRVSDSHGTVVYQPNSMAVLTAIIPRADELRKESLVINGRSFRAISRFAMVGPYTFLIQVAVDQTEYR
jgi:hypothetical protein